MAPRALPGLVRALLLGASLALAGCAASFDEAYRASHPDWEPDFPRLGADLLETLASLLTPTREHRLITQVQRLRVFDIGAEPWAEIPRRRIESGDYTPASDGDYIVVVRMQCSWFTRLEMVVRDAVSWYYLTENAVRAFEHAEFGQLCRPVPKVRGVPGHSELRDVIPTLLDRPRE